MTTKKLSARQARWAEYLSRYYFKLSYRTGKSNERADALSRKLEDTSAQDQVIAAHRTQVLLPQDKLADEVIRDLQLAPMETPSGSYDAEEGCSSIELIDKLLTANRTSLELEEL